MMKQACAQYIRRHKKWLYLLLLPAWVYGAFLLAGFVLHLVIATLTTFGVDMTAINTTILATSTSAMVYIIAIICVIAVPWWLWRRKTTAKELGITGLPSWWDILITPLAYVVYAIVSAIIVSIVVATTSLNLEQNQALPFTQSMLSTDWHYLLACLTLVVMAPVAEELLFRGYLYGKLRTVAPVWLSVLVASIVFGLAHLWTGEVNAPLQWAVALDTFALSLVMCIAREYTGAIWVPICMHMVKNGLAFYLLFINPTLIEQLRQAAVLL